MRWNKKQRESNRNNVNLEKQLESSSLTPLDFYHSDSFNYHHARVQDESRQIVNSYRETDSELVGTIAASIIAETRAEIAFGKEQYINHIYACQTIFEKEKGELARVVCAKKLLQSDLDRLKQSKDKN